MLYNRYRPGFFASLFVLFATGSACTKADESGAEGGAKEAVVPAGEDEPLAGHAFLRLTDATSKRLPDFFFGPKIAFALDELEDYYVSVGSRVLVVEHAGTTSPVRTIELPMELELLGIHDRQLVLFGKDPSRCEEEKRKPGQLYADPSRPPCASVFRRPSDEEGPTVWVADLPARNAVLAGDHVVALVDDDELASVSLATGEVRRIVVGGLHGNGELAVQGDRVLWDTIADKERSVVHQSRAPFDKAEVVFELEQKLEFEVILDIAWVGDGVVYTLGTIDENKNPSVKLYRRVGDQTDLLLTDLKGGHLTNDSASAWVTVGLDNEELWRIGLKQHRRVVTTTTPKFVTGTRSGLVWIEQNDSTWSFHLSGAEPPGLVAPEFPAPTLEMPVSPKLHVVGGGGESAKQEDPEPTVDGGLEADIIRRIIRAHINETRKCWDDVAKTQPDLAGTLTVAFVIGKNGKVSKTSVVGEPFDAGLGKCMTKAVGRWTFPKPRDGEPVDVSYPFAFPVAAPEPPPEDP